MTYAPRAAFLSALVLCSAAHAQAPQAPLTPARAERLLEEYVSLWSDDARVNAASVAQFYAPVVVYYGKRMDRRAVLADKLRYIRQYPERDYSIVPGSTRVRCEQGRSSCIVSGRMLIRLVDRRGRVTRRSASLRLEMIGAGGGQIEREQASR
ncbi:MAG TPA: hypothetical protein VIL72_04080 [Beijerinckiaceae bacterium]|jgi:hypothetical protein